MTEFTFANNAFATIATSEVGPTATTVDVDSDSTLPDLESGYTLRCNLVQLDSNGDVQAREIVDITNIDSNGTQLTIERGKENTAAITVYAGDRVELRDTAAMLKSLRHTAEELIIPISPEDSHAQAGDAMSFQLYYDRDFLAIGLSASEGPVGANAEVDLLNGSTSLLNTVVSIDDGESSSNTASTPPDLNASTLTKWTKYTVRFDQVGSTSGGKGYKLHLIVRRQA